MTTDPTPGRAIDELVRVVEALLADEGGCAWNRSQTHESLVTYLLEETHELVEAIEQGSAADRREELGDVLYQVVLHAALAARSTAEAFDLADVARDVSAKAIRRHPHVFGSDQATDLDDIVRVWSAAKAREKSARLSAYDGVAHGLPALARAQKIDQRRDGTGADRPTGPSVSASASATASATDELVWGRALLARVDEATDAGIDAERALRAAVREREDLLRARESGRPRV